MRSSAVSSTSTTDGQFLACRLHPTGAVVILRADPRVLISDEFLLAIEHGLASGPGVLDKTACTDGYTGAVLTLDAENQRVVYRLGRHRPALHAYEAEWPD